MTINIKGNVYIEHYHVNERLNINADENEDENSNTDVNVDPDKLKKNEDENENKNVPATLDTEEARVLWEKLKEAELVDEHLQPLISRTKAALLAQEMNERLGLGASWKIYEKLWNRKNIAQDLQKALYRKETGDFTLFLREKIGGF